MSASERQPANGSDVALSSIRTSTSAASPRYDAFIDCFACSKSRSPFAFSSALAIVAFSMLPKYGSNAAASSRLPFSFRPTLSGVAVTLPDTSSEPLRFSVVVSLMGSGFDRSSLICLTFSCSGANASFTGSGVERSVKFAFASFTFSSSIL